LSVSILDRDAARNAEHRNAECGAGMPNSQGGQNADFRQWAASSEKSSFNLMPTSHSSYVVAAATETESYVIAAALLSLGRYSGRRRFDDGITMCE